MHRKSWLAAVALLLGWLALSEYRAWRTTFVLEGMRDDIRRIAPLGGNFMGPLTWQSGGQPHTFGPVHSLPNETSALYAARYQKLLAQEMAAFPPDVPQ